MKKLIIILSVVLSLLSLRSIAQFTDTIYVDLNSATNGVGTIANPKNTIYGNTSTSNRLILVKRGTSRPHTKTYFQNNVDNVTIKTYGTGDRPILYIYNADQHFAILDAHNIRIDSLYLKGVGSSSIISINPWNNSLGNIEISNCVLDSCDNFIMIRKFAGRVGIIDGPLIIRDNIMNWCATDGIYGDFRMDELTTPRSFTMKDTMFILRNRMTNMNMNWILGKVAPGDPIQLIDSDNVWLEGNYIDKRNTSEKFNIILSHAYLPELYQDHWVIDNTLFTPKDTTTVNGTTILYMTHVDTAYVIGNRFIGRGTVDNMKPGSFCDIDGTGVAYIMYNVIDSCRHGSFKMDNGTYFSNNTWISVESSIYYPAPIMLVGHKIIGRNNIITRFGNSVQLINTAGAGTDFSNNIDIYTATPDYAYYQSQLNLVDLEGGDYHLTSASTLLNDLGVTMSWMPTIATYDQDSVPVGIVPDIGAYEYVPMYTTYYYDFSQPTNGTGTQASPFNTWNNALATNNTEHLFKRGVDHYMRTKGSRIYITNKNNIRIGAYGSGTSHPVLYGFTNSYGVIAFGSCNGIIIDSIKTDYEVGYLKPESGIAIGSYYSDTDLTGCTNTRITNCIITNAYNGIRGDPAKINTNYHTLIDNCEIYDITSDGIILWNFFNVTINNCRIYNINTRCYVVETCTGDLGDPIQIIGNTGNRSNGGGAYIHNCYLDKSNTPTKFTFILDQSFTGDPSRYIELVNNEFHPPKAGSVNGQTGSMLYLKNGTTNHDTIVFRRNLFSGRVTPYSAVDYVPTHIAGRINTEYAYFYDNIIDSVPGGGVYGEDMTGHTIHTEWVGNTITGIANTDVPMLDFNGYPSSGVIANNNVVRTNQAFYDTRGQVTFLDNNLNVSTDYNSWDSFINTRDWENGDYHLASDDNSGVDMSAYAYYDGIDYDSLYRSIPSDMGAYEYVETDCNNAPTAIIINSATGLSSSLIYAEWSATACADKYFVTVDNSADFLSPIPAWNEYDANTNTSLSINSGLSANTTYYIRIRGWNSVAGYGPYSAIATATTLATIPDAPTNLVAYNVGEVTAELSWSASTYATDYQISVDVDSDHSSPTFEAMSGGITNILVTGLSGDSTYNARVRAYNASGFSDWTANIQFTTDAAIECPPVPVQFPITNVTYNSFKMNWSVTGIETSWLLDVATNESFTSFLNGYQNYPVLEETTDFDIIGAEQGTHYFTRLRAVNSICTTDYSNVETITTSLILPTQPTLYVWPSTVTTKTVNLSWDNLEYEDYTSFEASLFPSFNIVYSKPIILLGEDSVLMGSLTANQTWYIRMKGGNFAGEGPYSNTVSITTPTTCVGPATGLNSVLLGSTSFLADWDDYPGLVGGEGYKISVSTSPTFFVSLPGYTGLDVGNTSQATIEGLTPGETYYWKVAIYKIGCSNPTIYSSTETIQMTTDDKLIKVEGKLMIINDGSIKAVKK